MSCRSKTTVIAVFCAILVIYGAVLFLLPTQEVMNVFPVVVFPSIAAGLLFGPVGGGIASVAFLGANVVRLLIDAPPGTAEQIGGLAFGSFNTVFAAVVVGLVSRLRRLWRHEATMRAAREKDLNETIQEKKMLVREVNHRVANHLNMLASMVGLQSRFMVDPDNKRKFEELRDRVTTLALLYRQLHHEPERDAVDFAAYVGELTANLRDSLTVPDTEIGISVAVPPVALPVDATTALALIISELITNAYKHAFTGRSEGSIHITLEATAPDHLQLTVENDGAPLPAQEADSKRLGMTVIRGLVAQIHGTFSSGPATPDGNGARFVVTFPRPE
jgi:two-component sensor histidine kinase